jgi:hypothetical protein
MTGFGRAFLAIHRPELAGMRLWCYEQARMRTIDPKEPITSGGFQATG